VVDTMGRPIKDAEVSVWGKNYDLDISGNTVEQLFPETKTDGEGDVCVRFEPNTTVNNIFIFAQKAGFAVGWNGVYCPVRITKIRIVLDRVNATAGIVTDKENRPIAGARVTAYPVDEVMIQSAQSHLSWPDSVFTTTTDHEGRFSFDCLAEWMTVGFAVEYPGRAYTDTSYNLQGQRLRHSKTGSKDIHITMHPPGRIKGRIIAKRGKKIAGIKLMAQGERIRIGKRFMCLSDADGYFSIGDLPPDIYLVTTAVAGNDPTQQITAGAIAEVEVGQTVEDVKIRMRDPVKLDVIVRDIKTNQPIRDASVNVYQHRASKIVSHLSYNASTDNGGIAKIILLPGKCFITLDHNDYDLNHGVYLVKSSDTNLQIGLVPNKSTISGQVVYEDGRAAAEVEVRVSTFETEHKLTDANGNFKIMFSASGAQKGFVIAREMEKGLAGLVDITEHEGPVKVILKPAATLKGRVVDPGNMPVDNARVRISYKIPHYFSSADNFLYTDKHGQFELRAVPFEQEDFKYRVSISAYRYGRIDYKKIDVNKNMGEIIELSPFVLKPRNMTVSGRAVHEDGTAAAYKQVHLSDVHHMHGQPNLHDVTDADGYFHFDGACEGWLKLQCGSVLNKDFGMMRAKGGDRVTVIMDNNYESLQMYTTTDRLESAQLPMYDTLTKGIKTEKLEDKKLLVCFWYVANDQSKKIVTQLTRITDELDKANIFVVLLNSRPHSKKYASVNIGADKKWLKKNNIPFLEADVPIMEDIMEIRRATGAQFLPHMILTDENKVITKEVFDVQWLKDNVL
jgi:uncharacterized GH25 family protein